MELLRNAIAWIADNESALSGIAAMIVVAGVVFTPLGAGLRRYLSGRGEVAAATPAPARDAPLAAVPEPEPADSGPVTDTDTASESPAPSRPSIAVLPFDNMSSDEEQEYLADGMTEDIITGLSANRHLHVVSRNSTFAYKGTSPDIRQVGRELGVRYVLEGSVRRVGERMRTTAQLIEADSGAHLWAEKYDRPFANMFDVQDEVVESIAGALHAQINSAEYHRARHAPRANPSAWEMVQKAFSGFVFESPSVANSDDMLASLRAALEIDPEYVYAHAALAWVLFAAAINGFTKDPRGAIEEADSHLARSLEGDVDDPLTLFYAGAAYIYSGRHERGIMTLERSLLYNPHQPDVQMHLGVAHGYMGHFEQAYQHFDRAQVLSPTGGMSVAYGWYRAIVLGFEARYEEAMALIRAHLERAPRYAAARVELGLDLAALGRPDEARACVERAKRDDPEICLDGLTLLFAAHPDPEAGAQRVAWLREYWPAG